jgi:hypothetical protein
MPCDEASKVEALTDDPLEQAVVMKLDATARRRRHGKVAK